MSARVAPAVVEVNFDGIIGPSHNYAGLSFGNVASHDNAGMVSRPRAAALQGLAKMRRAMALGLRQGFLPPHQRPHVDWLRSFGFDGDDEAVCAVAAREEPGLFRAAMSASPMWTANAATFSPAADTADGRGHFSVANLSTMLHRGAEASQTARQLRVAFADTRHFAVHDPVAPSFGDEGAANIMRLAARHGDAGLEIFVYGEAGDGGFPARQDRVASAAVARRHGLAPAATMFVRQSDAAIAAGAFHNDVVAVANEQMLFAHEQAFADRDAVYADIRARAPFVTIVEAPSSRVSLAAAVRTYLFNSQLVTLPGGGMALILPAEVRDDAAVWAWLQDVLAADNPITRLEVLDVRESMRNGGGPACLRLRVTVDEAALAAIDARFLLDDAKADAIAGVVTELWPDSVSPADLVDPDLWRQCARARAALLSALGLDGVGL